MLPPKPEPCTLSAYDHGCTCSMPCSGPTDIDPPEPRVDRDCPFHGTPVCQEYEYEDRFERNRVRELVRELDRMRERSTDWED